MPDMTRPGFPTSLLLCSLLLFTGAAQAHPGHGETLFWSGLLHPLGGVDHALAMLAVGLWSARREPTGTRALLTLPILFIGGACLGIVWGMVWDLAGGMDGRVETALAVSLLPLGLALMAGLRGNHRIALFLVPVCGLLHGAAHGNEWLGQPLAGVAGFLLGTALLHAAGAASMRALSPARRHLGAAGMGAGLTASALWLLA
jgi:urease accessory protein